MTKIIISLFLATIFIFYAISSTSAADGFDVRCTAEKNETITVDNQTTIMLSSDSCDATKFLTCRADRCACQDPLKQIYTYREYKQKDLPPSVIRFRRSPGKGKSGGGGGKSKSKGVGTGTAIVGGAVVGLAGYEIGKAVAGSSNGGHYSSGSSSSSSSNSKLYQVHSCYARVNGDCAVDPKKSNTVITTVKTESANETISTTQTTQVDYAKWPICIDKAICKPKQNTTVGADSNIGECICKDGYSRTTTDLCQKNNASSRMNSVSIFGLSLCFLFIQLVTNKVQ